jgi:hypothetical protein
MRSFPELPLQGEGGVEILHASGILAGSGVVALCARSGTGKSTMATHLQQRGYVVWADDAVIWTSSEAGAITFPFPFRLGVGKAASRAAGESAGSDPRALKAIFVLERIEQSVEGDDVAVGPVSGASALTSVLPHAHSFSLCDERRRRDFVTRYVHLAATIPVVHVRFRHDVGKIGALCDTFERLLDGIDSGGRTVPR